MEPEGQVQGLIKVLTFAVGAIHPDAGTPAGPEVAQDESNGNSPFWFTTNAVVNSLPTGADMSL